MKDKNYQRQLKLAEVLFESGMELPVIEKITGVEGPDLLAQQILSEKNSKE